MNKRLKTIFLIAPLALIAPGLVLADGNDFMTGLFGALGISAGLNIFSNISGAPNIGEVIMNVIKFVLGIVGALTLLVVIIGGLRYVMSAGNQDQMEGAKKTLLYAVIGFIVIILAYTIVTLVDKIVLH